MPIPARANALVQYKQSPAVIVSTGDKYEIRLPDGKTKKVRDKDILVLHAGPVSKTSDYPMIVDIDPSEALELLEGESVTLEDLTDLLFSDDSARHTWDTWVMVRTGLYFEAANPDEIQPRDPEVIAADIQAKAEKAAKAAEWEALLERLQKGEMIEDDRKPLSEVERLALDNAPNSKILKALGKKETPEEAHKLLIKTGYWPEQTNPWPYRFGLTLGEPELEIPTLPEEEREDLTHQESWAIDDAGSTDPDDAIALDGDMLWVHVADVAALVTPDSELDLAARERVSNLYLPETTYHMLPRGITDQLGLGLQDTSPALSFGMKLDADGHVSDFRITPSWVKVKRTTYEDAEQELDDGIFSAINAVTERFYLKRQAQGSAVIRLPEVKVKVDEGKVSIKDLPPLRSRAMVTNAMLMAGEAAARYAQQHLVPFPYCSQVAPPAEESAGAETLAEMWALRKQFKRTQLHTSPGTHGSLGLHLYSQTTSPLRRYLDLVVHQQLRAHLKGETTLDHETMLERIALADNQIGMIRKAERHSNRHWTLVYLTQNPGWKGKGVLVDKRDKRGTVLLPELAFDTQMQVGPKAALDQEYEMTFKSARFPELLARFEYK